MPSEALPNDRDIWRIAAPMILSNISVPLLGMVDTGVTGHLEDAVYLGAVAIGSTIFGFLYAGFNFLRMGTTGITAQAHGAGDQTLDDSPQLLGLGVGGLDPTVLKQTGRHVPVHRLAMRGIAPQSASGLAMSHWELPG